MPDGPSFQRLAGRDLSERHRPAHVHVIGADVEAACPLHHASHGGGGNRRPARPKRVAEAAREFRLLAAGEWSESMAISDDKFERASARMAAKRAGPVAVAARYDRARGRVVVSLSTGLELAFPPQVAEGLAKATPSELARIDVTPSGLGLHWPKLDADLYLPALLAGAFGSKRWMAAELGAAGGRARSPAKSAAARRNGKRGGRPPKRAARA